MGRWSEVAKTLNSPFLEVPLTAINPAEGRTAVNGSDEKAEIQKKTSLHDLELTVPGRTAVNGSDEKGESREITETVKEEWATDPPTHTPETRPTLERLPNALERMVRAASNDALATGTAKLPSGLVMDLNAYVVRWACSYLTGDTQEASRRLLEVYTALHGGKA